MGKFVAEVVHPSGFFVKEFSAGGLCKDCDAGVCVKGVQGYFEMFVEEGLSSAYDVCSSVSRNSVLEGS